MSIFDNLHTLIDEDENGHAHRRISQNEKRSDNPKKKTVSRTKHFEGNKFSIHGAFKDKEGAKKKEKKVKGSFIEEREIKGEKRYVVLKAK